MNEKTKRTLLNGIFDNPILVLTLGLCPVIGVSTTFESAVFIGVATLVVLLFSNVIISLLKNLIGEKIRIVAYILIISTFVTVIEILTKRMFPDVYANIGIYIAIIAVNCVIFGRAEGFASRNNLKYSVLDGLSIGLGYLAIISLMGFIREIFGNNTLGLFGVYHVLGSSFVPLKIFTTMAGGFFTLAAIMGGINAIVYLSKKLKEKDEAAKKLVDNSEVK